MIVYQTASGTLYTPNALYEDFVAGLREDHDPANGPFDGSMKNQYQAYKDWLVEAINTGVIRERTVLT